MSAKLAELQTQAKQLGADGFIVKTDDLRHEIGDMISAIGKPAKAE